MKTKTIGILMLVIGLMAGGIISAGAGGGGQMTPYAQLPGGDLRVLEDWHPGSDPQYVIKLTNNNHEEWFSLRSACPAPNEPHLVAQWIGGSTHEWTPVLETDRWAWSFSGAETALRVPFGRLQVSANEELTRSDGRTWIASSATWRCINQFDTRIPLMAKPPLQAVKGVRRATGEGLTDRFEAGESVLGAYIKFDTGKECFDCYVESPGVGGHVTSGVVFPTPGEIAKVSNHFVN